MGFESVDRDRVLERYRRRFDEHGESQQALGWGPKGRQRLRFRKLLESSNWELSGASALDLGAGFGELYDFLVPFGISAYCGVELVPSFVETGIARRGEQPGFQLHVGDCQDLSAIGAVDATFISGLFNFALADGDNYSFIRTVLDKALRVSRLGVAANFVTDRVDRRDEVMFYANPERILSIALGLSRNVKLCADYMPFEFTLVIDNRQGFDPDLAVFEHVEVEPGDR